MLDGTKAYVHAVIDNFSRKILAWTVGSRLDPMNTHAVLTTAASNLAASAKAEVFMDSGVENLNGEVDPLFEGGVLERHNWLFLHPLDNLTTVKRLVEFYVTEHNERIPHSAFEGQTPDEVYFGRGDHIPDGLAVARREARNRRVELNRAVACAACPRGTPAPPEHLAA